MLTTHTPLQPFDPANEAGYQAWREAKLARIAVQSDDRVVPVKDVASITEQEHAAILEHCRQTNLAIYEVTGGGETGKQAIRAFGRQFGLESLDMNLRADEDSITSLRVVEASAGTHYIPYTNRPLNWHTDGYYNRLDRQVRGIVMHCVSAAASGGDNLFLDPELAYLLLRDENPDYIRALMQPDAMTIPANIEGGVELRPAQSGPVFSVAGDLAAGFLLELLAGDSIYIIRHRLRAGQGIICNNVLHKREAFNDDATSGQQRLLYRARYHERIRGT
jgi:alpha-ketoglutarate-dependent taurine dioxygenase